MAMIMFSRESGPGDPNSIVIAYCLRACKEISNDNKWITSD